MQEKDQELGLSQSIEELFLASQESYEEAQQRSAEENKSFAKTEYFKMDKLGVYRIRILPIAPRQDGTTDRRTYEYPVRQYLMALEKPSDTPKSKTMYVSVPRAIDAGYTVDLLDTYKELAVSQARANGDEKMAEKIGGGSYGGGLKYNYSHAMYILDIDERVKGIQLLNLSHSQFKDLDDRKFKLWQKKLSKNPGYPCPVSSINNAYPVEIEKRNNGGKTEYLISIDNESDPDTLSKEEMTALMNAPRIPEIINRYTRYQFEATLEFLKQYDEKHSINIMQHPEMKEAIETLRNELPKEDISSFSFDKRTKENKDSEDNNHIWLDELFARLQELKDKGLKDRTEEGQQLRLRIRGFIEQEKLPLKINRLHTNEQVLSEIERMMESSGYDDDPANDLPF